MRKHIDEKLAKIAHPRSSCHFNRKQVTTDFLPDYFWSCRHLFFPLCHCLKQNMKNMRMRNMIFSLVFLFLFCWWRKGLLEYWWSLPAKSWAGVLNIWIYIEGLDSVQVCSKLFCHFYWNRSRKTSRILLIKLSMLFTMTKIF